MQRVGDVKEVSAAVVFFSLPSASYVTGQTLAVDGGFTVNSF
jgi:Tropinone reductase 1